MEWGAEARREETNVAAGARPEPGYREEEARAVARASAMLGITETGGQAGRQARRCVWRKGVDTLETLEEESQELPKDIFGGWGYLGEMKQHP